MPSSDVTLIKPVIGKYGYPVNSGEHKYLEARERRNNALAKYNQTDVQSIQKDPYVATSESTTTYKPTMTTQELINSDPETTKAIRDFNNAKESLKRQYFQEATQPQLNQGRRLSEYERKQQDQINYETERHNDYLKKQKQWELTQATMAKYALPVIGVATTVAGLTPALSAGAAAAAGLRTALVQGGKYLAKKAAQKTLMQGMKRLAVTAGTRASRNIKNVMVWPNVKRTGLRLANYGVKEGMENEAFDIVERAIDDRIAELNNELHEQEYRQNPNNYDIITVSGMPLKPGLTPVLQYNKNS